ncbi:hypothetical protein [Tunicatimonas pelagia]|uniref:hypothetical protein n=1 Tax=Tunicatimonas pelagia TaxID=931531 RepID=UPI0026668DCB|nr:hypothetical protein [Tunicatimonas pelagia]WKN41016.1 hypothetical protein P0M28_18440 [Tunicatimonas pelagia]
MKSNIVVWVLLLPFIFTACSEDDDGLGQPKINSTSDVVTELQGTWSSDGILEFPIDAPGSPFAVVYQTETFTFTDTLNTINVSIFADEGLTTPVLNYRSTGPFTILGTSSSFEKTWEADFANTEQSLEILLDNRQLLDALGFSACGITEANVVYDITDGCSIFPGIDECIEQDIIQLKNNTLRFGSREGDICANRASSLQDIIYTKD